MIQLLLLPILIAGFDLGGNVGGVFPSTGLVPGHSSGAALGAAAGWSSGPNRLEISYSYAGLTGPQTSAYRLDISEVALRYAFEFVRRPDWGIDVAAGPGIGFVRRNFYDAHEDGKSPAAHLGVNFVQHQVRTRVFAGLDNTVFFGSRRETGSTRLAAAWLITLKAGVSYVF